MAISIAEIGVWVHISIKLQITSSWELWKNPKRGLCRFNSSQNSVPLFKHLSSLRKRLPNVTDSTTIAGACTKKWRRNSVPGETVPVTTCSRVLIGHPPATAATSSPQPFRSLCWTTAGASAWPGVVIKMLLYLCTKGLIWSREGTGQNPNQLNYSGR